jgi:hypothetical protein
MSGVEAAKRLAARTAVDAFVKNGFKLGIGSGSKIIQKLSERTFCFQGLISDRKAEQVFKTETGFLTGPKTVFLNRTGCHVLLENLSKILSRILSPVLKTC